MTDQPDDPRFRDPLSEVTRKERKFLLGVSVATIVLTSLHEKITKIPAIETEALSVGSQRAILIALALVVGYALVAFAIYAWTDFVAWRQSIARSDIEILSRVQRPTNPLLEDEVFGVSPPDPKHQAEIRMSLDLAFGRNSKWTRRARRGSFWRAAWDFLLPAAVGLMALAMASWRALTTC
jgi:hypothetical protein